MTHPRRQIRALWLEKLTGSAPDYATVAQDRVFGTMTPPIDIEGTLATDGPVLMVYVRHEEMREEDYGVERFDTYVRRRLEIAIEVLATGANVDDTLDDAAAQIEALIEPWDMPGFENADILLVNSQIDVSATQDRIVGGLFMTYHVKYLAPYRLDTSTFTIPEEVSVRPQDGVDPQVVSELVIDADGGLP